MTQGVHLSMLMTATDPVSQADIALSEPHPAGQGISFGDILGDIVPPAKNSPGPKTMRQLPAGISMLSQAVSLAAKGELSAEEQATADDSLLSTSLLGQIALSDKAAALLMTAQNPTLQDVDSTAAAESAESAENAENAASSDSEDTQLASTAVQSSAATQSSATELADADDAAISASQKNAAALLATLAADNGKDAAPDKYPSNVPATAQTLADQAVTAEQLDASASGKLQAEAGLTTAKQVADGAATLSEQEKLNGRTAGNKVDNQLLAESDARLAAAAQFSGKTSKETLNVNAKADTAIPLPPEQMIATDAAALKSALNAQSEIAIAEKDKALLSAEQNRLAIKNHAFVDNSTLANGNDAGTESAKVADNNAAAGDKSSPKTLADKVAANASTTADGKSGTDQSSQQQNQRQNNAFSQLADNPPAAADNTVSQTLKSAAEAHTSRSEAGFGSSLQAAELRQQVSANKTLTSAATEQLKQSLNLLQQDAPGQLRERVNLMLRQNIQVAEIRLNPAGLGQMQIKIDMQQEQASVQFIVQQPQAKELLEQQLPRLRDMLQQQGIVLGEGNVQQQSQQQERQLAQRDGNSGNGRQPHADDDALGEQPGGQAVQVSASISERLVDYYA